MYSRYQILKIQFILGINRGTMRLFRAFGLAALAVTVMSTSVIVRAQVAPEPALRRFSLADCVTAALGRNVDVRSAADDTRIAEAQRSGARGQFGPKVHLDASLQYWNEPYAFDGFPIHDRTVWNVTATATQPITTLFAIYDTYQVRDLGVDIAAVRHETVRRETAFRVVERYYRLLQAERLEEVSAASVDQLEAQLRQSNAFHKSGTVSLDDVLRAQLALANARQRVIQARSRVTLERASLAALIGLSPDSPIDAQPLADELPTPEAASLAQAEKAAEEQRVELREVDKQIASMAHETRLAFLKLVPNVSVVGAYIHNEGSLFSPVNAGYVGAAASWDVWDWGTTTSGISEAKARAHQAQLARSKVDDRIRLEVQQAFIAINSAREAMAVAKASVALAEENFRLVQRRYDTSAATSFDVVDAEELLTQARGQIQTALYDFFIARAALRTAVGARPESLASR
jgi:outer membrane protein